MIWAQPVFFDGLPNLNQVSPRLYRGARPTAEGIARLAWMGVKTVIDLEAWWVLFDWNPFEAAAAWKAGMAYVSIQCSPWHPEIEDAIAFLEIVTDPAHQPVFVHCRQGSDRTGMMCAIYRIVVQGWTKEDAIAEMVNGGFGFHGTTWPQIVPFIQTLDISRLVNQ